MHHGSDRVLAVHLVLAATGVAPGLRPPSARVERAVASAAIVLPENAEWVRDARSGADPVLRTRACRRAARWRVRGSSPARSIVT